MRGISFVLLAIALFQVPTKGFSQDFTEAQELQIEASKINLLFNQLDIAKADQVTNTFFKITMAGFTGGLFIGGFLNEIGIWQDNWWMPSMVFGTIVGLFSGAIYEKTIFSQLRLSQRILNRYRKLLKRRQKSDRPLSSEEAFALNQNFLLILQYFEEGYFRTSLSRWKIISIYKLIHQLIPAEDFETAARRFHIFNEIYQFALSQVDGPLVWKAHSLREELILQLTSLEWEEHHSLTETKRLTGRSSDELLENYDTEIGNFSRYLVLEYMDVVQTSTPYLVQLNVSASGPRNVIVNDKLVPSLPLSRKINLEALSNLLQKNYPGVWIQIPHLSSVWQYFPDETPIPESWKGLEVRIFQNWPPKSWEIQTQLIREESIAQIKKLRTKKKATRALSFSNFKNCRRALKSFTLRQIF